MNLYKALRTLALRDVLTEPSDYHLRYIARWYSTNYNVALPEVMLMDPMHVLQTFYEVHYEQMSAEDREKERKLLLETDEQRRKREMDEEAELVSQFEFEQMSIAEAEKAEKQTLEESVKKAQELAKTKPASQGLPLVPKQNDQPLEIIGAVKPGDKLPPNISMRFADEDEFQREIEAADNNGVDNDPRAGNLKLKPAEE